MWHKSLKNIYKFNNKKERIEIENSKQNSRNTDIRYWHQLFSVFTKSFCGKLQLSGS
jgi:hypothetical protein